MCAAGWAVSWRSLLVQIPLWGRPGCRGPVCEGLQSATATSKVGAQNHLERVGYLC